MTPGTELLELISRMKDRMMAESALPSYTACVCGGAPHEGRLCGQGTCDCLEYELRDPEGHALKKEIEEVLK